MASYVTGTPVLVVTNPPFQSLLTSPPTVTTPTTVTLTVSVDGNTPVTFTWTGGVDPTGTIVNTGLGTFQALLGTGAGGVFAEPVGQWSYRWKGTGALVAKSFGSFTVTADPFG
jgi:hypothetical protein